ncbi:MAG: hypothetical protein RR400_02530 [Clostridia bacterium]
MSKFKKIVDICLIFLACFAVIIDCLYVYEKYINKDIKTGINYIDDQLGLDITNAKDLTEEKKSEFEERYFMTANYYDNSKKNGVELQELRYDYFTDWSLLSTSYRSTGMQFLGNFQSYNVDVANKKEADTSVDYDFYYYDTTNGISWSGANNNKGTIGTELNRETALIIKIGGKPYSIQLTGQYDFYKNFLGIFPMKYTTVFDYGSVFDCVFRAIKSNSASYGDYYITVDLSKYFTIREYDIAAKKFKIDDVTDVIKNYSVLKFHYDANGAVASKQSIFGSIECNPNFDKNELNVDTTYWQEKVNYTLTEQDLLYRYSEAYQGYLVAPSIETKNLFKKMERAKVKIEIDLDSKFLKENKKNIVGFDYNAFENFSLDTVKITSVKVKTFYFLEKSLFNTNLKYLEGTKFLTFEFVTNSTSNEFSEVIL